MCISSRPNKHVGCVYFFRNHLQGGFLDCFSKERCLLFKGTRGYCCQRFMHVNAAHWTHSMKKSLWTQAAEQCHGVVMLKKLLSSFYSCSCTGPISRFPHKQPLEKNSGKNTSSRCRAALSSHWCFMANR